MDDQLDSLCVSPDASIREVIRCIDRNSKGIALVADNKHRLTGTVTDGDIRRAVLNGISLDMPVKMLLDSKKNSLYPQPITAPLGTDKSVLLELMRKHTVRQVPLLDSQGCVADLVLMRELVPHLEPSMQALVMAGGRGKRLRPLTEDLPKPMLPIGNRPILELIIDQLRDAGIRQVSISTHYKPEKITEHFGNGDEFGVKLNYVSEDTPLGTAGALGLMDVPQEPVLVINGDIFTQVDLKAMLNYHCENKADLTVAVREYDFQVPYGVLECEGHLVCQIKEKPKYSFFINAGIYLLQPSVYHYIHSGQHLDMTELIEVLIAEERPVISFPIVEYWLDIGQHTDYQQAQEDLKNGRFSS